MTKILVAEDERDIRELIGYTLRFGGFEVTLANNGAEAIEMAKTEDPDLIVLDVRMPRMTGYEACEKLKQDPQVSHIPVVFLSAKGQEAEIRQGIEAGAVGYIIKPFVPDELVKQVREIVEKASSTAEPASVPAETPDTGAVRSTATVEPSGRETQTAGLWAEPPAARPQSIRRRFDWSSNRPDRSDSGTEHSGSQSKTSGSETPDSEA